jgi:hypothetical protein
MASNLTDVNEAIDMNKGSVSARTPVVQTCQDAHMYCSNPLPVCVDMCHTTTTQFYEGISIVSGQHLACHSVVCALEQPGNT